MSTNPISLTETQRESIVRFVRDEAARYSGTSVSAATETTPAQRLSDPESMTGAELSYGGLFVTFKTADRLRGCMGLFGAEQSFAVALRRATILALNDPRFTQNPIRAEELEHLTIEVSILTAPQIVDDFSRLVPGRHGVIISGEGRQGCFLPQVAAERGWDIPTFLSECCRLKADLPPDAWRNPATTVRTFEAVVICGPASGQST